MKMKINNFVNFFIQKIVSFSTNYGSIINSVGEKFHPTIFIYKKMSHIKDL